MIRKLQGDLHQIQKYSEEHIKKTKSEAEKQEASDVKASEGKKTKLQQEITQLRTQLQALTSEHRQSEQTLRKVSCSSATICFSRAHLFHGNGFAVRFPEFFRKSSTLKQKWRTGFRNTTKTWGKGRYEAFACLQHGIAGYDNANWTHKS